MGSRTCRDALRSFLHLRHTDAAIALVFDAAAREEAPAPCDRVLAVAMEVLDELSKAVRELQRGRALPLVYYMGNCLEWAKEAGLALPFKFMPEED